MGIHLHTGHFFGESSRVHRGAHVTLSELTYRAVRKLPSHSHESAYVSLLVRGEHRDRLGNGVVTLAPYQAGFRPADTEHNDEIGSGDNLFFNIEIPSAFLDGLISDTATARMSPMLCSAPATVAACRLYRGFRGPAFSDLDAESAVAGMVGEIGGMSRVHERSTPRWLTRTIDLLRETYGHPVTLVDVAREAEVHAVHLSRVFRAKLGMNLGEYVNLVRVQQACRSLAGGETALCDIALACGFADQSHFSRVFKAAMGVTPSQFRKARLE